MFSFSVLFPHLLFCCEPLYWSGIQIPLKVPQSSHDLISALMHFQFAPAGVERLVSITWLKDADVRMKTLMHPPAVCCFITDSPISNWLFCSSPLIVPPAALPSSVCNKEIHRVKHSYNKNFDSNWYLFSFPRRARESFLLLLISWIICSLCINHGVPSGMCSHHCVRNSHSDLN